MKKLLCLCFFVLFLSACGSADFDNEKEALLSNDIGETTSERLLLPHIHDKKPIAMLRIDGEDYVVGLYDENHYLEWYSPLLFDETIKVSLEDIGEDEQYIERIENEVDFWQGKIVGKNGKYRTLSAVYVVHVSKNNVKGGQYKEGCGENCSKTIQTTIIE